MCLLKKVLLIKPNLASLHNNLGNILRELGNIEGAIESYEAALSVNSDFADETLSAYFRYGKTYSKLKTNFRANVSNSIFNNIVNNQQIESKTLSHSYQGSVATKFKDAPNFEIGYQNEEISSRAESRRSDPKKRGFCSS